MSTFCAAVPCAVDRPVGLSHWRVGITPEMTDASTILFRIHPDPQVIQRWNEGSAPMQLHRLMLQNLLDKDFIRDYHLLVVDSSTKPRVLSLLTSADLQRGDTDLYYLDFLWDTPLLLDYMANDQLVLVCKTLPGAAVNVIGPHANGNSLTLWIEVAASGTGERAKYERQRLATGVVGPFRYQTYRFPSTWLLTYQNGHLVNRVAKPYREQSEDPFSDEAFYDAFWPSAEDSLAS